MYNKVIDHPVVYLYKIFAIVSAFIKPIRIKSAKKLNLYGTSHGAVNHSRIRMGLSGLNQHRHKYNLINSGRCHSCNFIREDALHYFNNCLTHATHREVMLREICKLLAPNIHPNLLLPQSPQDKKDFLELIVHGSSQSDFEVISKQTRTFLTQFMAL